MRGIYNLPPRFMRRCARYIAYSATVRQVVCSIVARQHRWRESDSLPRNKRAAARIWYLKKIEDILTYLLTLIGWIIVFMIFRGVTISVESAEHHIKECMCNSVDIRRETWWTSELDRQEREPFAQPIKRLPRTSVSPHHAYGMSQESHP